MISLTRIERVVIQELAAGLPEGPEPYAAVAQRLGLAEESVLGVTRDLLARGVIRRVAAVVNDRRLGYQANAMVAWRVEPAGLEQAGAAAAARPEISHVYERRTTPEWPFNLYTMIHAKSREDVEAIVKQLSRKLRATDHTVLFTLREFTKRAPDYAALVPNRLEAPPQRPRDAE